MFVYIIIYIYKDVNAHVVLFIVYLSFCIFIHPYRCLCVHVQRGSG